MLRKDLAPPIEVHLCPLAGPWEPTREAGPTAPPRPDAVPGFDILVETRAFRSRSQRPIIARFMSLWVAASHSVSCGTTTATPRRSQAIAVALRPPTQRASRWPPNSRYRRSPSATEENANTNASTMVIRSRFCSATDDPAAVDPTPPPIRSERPPPLPECSNTNTNMPRAEATSKTTKIAVSTAPPTDHTLLEHAPFAHAPFAHVLLEHVLLEHRLPDQGHFDPDVSTSLTQCS
jgi:hypothetical protein